MANTRYDNQRARVIPPHVSLGVVRKVAKLTLDQACERFHELTGSTLSRGALSGIENGHRGASAEVIKGLALVYDIAPSDIDTNYQPRVRAA